MIEISTDKSGDPTCKMICCTSGTCIAYD